MTVAVQTGVSVYSRQIRKLEIMILSDRTSIGPAKAARRDLDVFMRPKAVAVIGATERVGAMGRTLLWNLITGPFRSAVYPVNLKRSNILGLKAYPSLEHIPEQVDLAVIVTPAETVPGVIHECVDHGVKGAIIISAGFKEAGARGAELERQVLAEAYRGKIRVIGPNCMGVMCPINGLNASFAQSLAQPGSIGFISQSGALCTTILDWSLREHVGFSAFFSVGSMVDVGWGDLIDYLGDDPNTRSIVIYMESVGDIRKFLSAAREVALNKPIIVIKAGRSAQAAKAAACHTGALTGRDEVLDAALRRVGVWRVNNISDIFYLTEVLASQRRPQGPRLAIITNAGGPGVLATDSLLEAGGELAEISPATMEQLNRVLPPHWSHNNPIDIIGDAGPDRYKTVVEIMAKDPDNDGLLVIITRQGMTDVMAIAQFLQYHAKQDSKPIIVTWMGGDEAAAGGAILNRAGIPTFQFPETAVRIFQYMWRYSYNLRSLYETPTLADDEGGREERTAATRIIETVRESGRTILTEAESKRLLRAYGIPVVETRLAATEDEAAVAAEEIGYPVALKLNSKTITHKTDVGGVRLNLADGTAVRDAFHMIERSVTKKAGAGHFDGVSVQPMIASQDGYELIIGSSIDPQFGPVLLFGAGGQLVEVFQDHAVGLPPLNSTLARRMMEQTRIFIALQGVRGRKPVDIGALEQLLVRFSQLVVEQPLIKELDINPLLATSERLVALDARVVLQGKEVDAAKLPHLAIRPYPAQYSKTVRLHDGSELTLRPIRPEDEPQFVKFHQTLSDFSVYMRYFQWLKLEQRTAHERLTRMCFVDYDRQIAFVAVRTDPKSGNREITGVGRLVELDTPGVSELLVIVSDPFQRRGIGAHLMERMIEFAKAEKVQCIVGTILYENLPMRKLFERYGFTIGPGVGRETLGVELKLS
jgi:acetyltransferase